MDYTGLVIISAAALLLMLLIFGFKLKTRIDEFGLVFGFCLFGKPGNAFSWEEIHSAEVIACRPIRDFGGWGYRYGLKGKAYTVRGRHSIRIVSPRGIIYVGTQQPQSVQRVLLQYVKEALK